jgi:hypothetical protein
MCFAWSDYFWVSHHSERRCNTGCRHKLTKNPEENAYISKAQPVSYQNVVHTPRVVHFEIDAKNLKKPSSSMRTYSAGSLKSGKDPSTTGW